VGVRGKRNPHGGKAKEGISQNPEKGATNE